MKPKSKSAVRARFDKKAARHTENSGRLNLAGGYGLAIAAAGLAMGPAAPIVGMAGAGLAANALKDAAGERRKARDTRLRGAAIEQLAARQRSGSGAFMTPKAESRSAARAEAPATRRAAAAPETGKGGQVEGYTRRDGVRVAGYTRQRGN